jgi:hypothetical protein
VNPPSILARHGDLVLCYRARMLSRKKRTSPAVANGVVYLASSEHRITSLEHRATKLAPVAKLY